MIDVLLQVLSLIGFILFHIVMLIGLVLIPIGLPGSWLILAAALIFGVATGFEDISGNVMLLLLGLAVLGEVVEFLLGVFVAKHYGASKFGLWGAFFGGIAGGIAGTGVLPIAGSVVGAMFGAFAGAFIMECLGELRSEQRMRAGFGALIGRVIATTMKLGIGLIMVFLIILRLYR